VRGFFFAVRKKFSALAARYPLFYEKPRCRLDKKFERYVVLLERERDRMTTSVLNTVDSLMGMQTINGLQTSEWVWYCKEHNQAGTASSKQEAVWLAEAHDGFHVLRNTTPEQLEDVDESGIPLVKWEDLSECKIGYMRNGTPVYKNKKMELQLMNAEKLS
jgi:hypothetical protein